jgi:hemolysin activation/secretion protein
MLIKNELIMIIDRCLCVFFFACFVLLVATQASYADGFLEMPDVSEVPEYERESMLLDLDIPGVRDRDPDPQGGARLNVKEFRIQGLVEYPELGITREKIIEKVESIRFDLMQEGEQTDSGYTQDELGEVSDLIAEIEKDTAERHVGPLEVQKLVFLIREQRRRRGVTVGMIETVSDTITRYYRERGFILAKAYIPKQQVRDGIVTLTLLLGELGDVKVENNRRVSKKAITSVFKSDLNKPVTSSNIEESLYLVNDIPGVSVQGFFQPGSQVGDTSLTVNVLKERWYSSNFRLDNHGSETTGANRAYADVLIHNPLGLGDQIHLSLLNSFNPENTTYGSFLYSTHIFGPRFRASLGVSSNDFISEVIGLSANNAGDTNVVSTAELRFSGKSEVKDLSFSYHFKRSRVKNFSTSLRFTDISTTLDTFVGDSTDALRESSEVFNSSLIFNFDVLQEKSRRLHIGNISLISTDNAPIIQNSDDVIVDEEVKQSAVFLSYDYSMLSFFRVPFTQTETRLVIKSAGQYTGAPMTNVNQFSVTGPNRARGFKVNEALFDDSLYLGVDWVLKMPRFMGSTFFGQSLDRVFQPFLFADYGYGVLHPIVAGDVSASGGLSNIGFGLKVNYSSFSSSVSFTKAITDGVNKFNETPRNGVYFELQYSL